MGMGTWGDEGHQTSGRSACPRLIPGSWLWSRGETAALTSLTGERNHGADDFLRVHVSVTCNDLEC